MESIYTSPKNNNKQQQQQNNPVQLVLMANKYWWLKCMGDKQYVVKKAKGTLFLNFVTSSKRSF